MDLLCIERSGECNAYADPRLLGDPRVLRNMLKTEETYTTGSSYFKCVQTEITPQSRRILADWMLEVTEEERCDDGVFPLAMNCLDRFLATTNVKKSLLQTLGAVCLLIASKLREPRPLTAKMLVRYTDFSMFIQHIPRWELLVANKLKWDLSAITAVDFLGHILHKLPIDERTTTMCRRHSATLIGLASREYKFNMYTPSILAGAAVAASLSGLNWTDRPGWSLPALLDALARMLSVEKDYMYTCVGQLEEILSETLIDVAAKEKPTTPTDIRDIDF